MHNKGGIKFGPTPFRLAEGGCCMGRGELEKRKSGTRRIKK